MSQFTSVNKDGLCVFSEIGDSMEKNNGMEFTANGTEYDHDLTSINCAEVFRAPWWYAVGSESRPTGQYGIAVPDQEGYLDGVYTTFQGGIMWKTYLGNDEHPRILEMKIRPQ